MAERRTTALPRAPTADMTGASGSSAQHSRRFLRLTGGLLVFLVVGQRLAIPVAGSAVPMTLIASYIVIVALLAQGFAEFDRLKSALFIGAMTACVTAAYLATWTGTPVSLLSVLLLIAVQALWTLRSSAPVAVLHRSLAVFYVRLMVFFAIVGSGQMALQLSGVWEYEDLLLVWLPESLLLPDFAVSIPIEYGSDIIKANAFVFLEPSFFSQFCALALIIAALLRAPAWQLVVLTLGLISALSGTGLLLAAVGGVALVMRSSGSIRPSYFVAVAVGLIVVTATPASELLLERAGEPAQAGSSGSLRFVQPYSEVARGIGEDDRRYLVGAGPGSSERLLSSDRERAGQAVVYTIVPKLAFEYGLIAGGLFSAFIAFSVLWRPSMPVLPVTLLCMIFFLSGSLLQPHTVTLAWLLTGFFADRRPPPR